MYFGVTDVSIHFVIHTMRELWVVVFCAEPVLLVLLLSFCEVSKNDCEAMTTFIPVCIKSAEDMYKRGCQI